MKLLYIDLFCGAGGTSTGVENARYGGDQCAKVIGCVNHDANAIASHAANHPGDALHGGYSHVGTFAARHPHTADATTYVLVGTQADQKKFIGNAVEVNMARVLCESLCARLIEGKTSPKKEAA
jgi:site-specific DNA-cytosine methylase